MSVTIRVNGLTITHNGSGGKHMSSVPDVCKAPGKGIPVPYSITAKNADIVKGTTTVLADGGNTIAHKPSEFSRCTGDGAGSMKGVASGTNLAQSNWITYSPDVRVEGENVCRLSDKLFMKNRNCISGVGGQVERVFDTGDVVLDALCEIFCEVRDDWQECRRAVPNRSCTNPSITAEARTNDALGRPNSRLRRGIETQFPGRVGAAERRFRGIVDEAFEGARRIFDESRLRNAIRNRINRLMRNRVIDGAARLTRRQWMKLVPGLNLFGGIMDAIELGTAAYDIYDLMSNADAMFDRAVEIRPDFAIMDEDGALEEIYDYMFDAPASEGRRAYQDTMDPESEQYRTYRQLSGRNPNLVNEDTCRCDQSANIG